jgi:hypothetical protein
LRLDPSGLRGLRAVSSCCPLRDSKPRKRGSKKGTKKIKFITMTYH